MIKQIYFDNAASTQVDPRVLKEMLPYFTETYGNASSLHSHGDKAKEALENSRIKISSLVKIKPEEMIFTSGGTESNNFALKGVAFPNRAKGNHIITSAIEHDCILNTCRWLGKCGFDITYLPVDSDGFVEPNLLEKNIREDTILVSIMHANNEIGTIEPIEEMSAICREKGIYFHTDACQSFGKLQIEFSNCDLVTINSHKIYGPKGVGALYIKEGTNIMPWQHGGNQERGFRSSTENIPGIVGFAKAVELCLEESEGELIRLKSLRDKIIANVLENIEGAYLNGPRGERRLSNNVNLGFNGLEGQAPNLLMKLDKFGFSVSTGSACTSNSEKKFSHVLTAIGRNPVQAIGALRISLGRYNTDEEVDYFLKVLPKALNELTSIFSKR